MQEQFPKQKIKQTAHLMKLLSSAPRMGILCVISQGEMSVGQISEKIKLSQSAVSQHLNKLRNAKIVKTRKEKQTVYYSLHDEKVKEIMSALHGIYCK